MSIKSKNLYLWTLVYNSRNKLAKQYIIITQAFNTEQQM